MVRAKQLGMAVACIICVMPGVASAQTAGGISAGLVSKELQARGFPAKIDRDPDGDPRITTRADGRELQVWFYKCSKDQATADRICEEIQFFSRFVTPRPIALSVINNWNTTERFLKVYSYKQKNGKVDTHAEFDVIIEGTGAPPSQIFNRSFDKMTDRLKDFERAILK